MLLLDIGHITPEVVDAALQRLRWDLVPNYASIQERPTERRALVPVMFALRVLPLAIKVSREDLQSAASIAQLFQPAISGVCRWQRLTLKLRTDDDTPTAHAQQAKEVIGVADFWRNFLEVYPSLRQRVLETREFYALLIFLWTSRHGSTGRLYDEATKKDGNWILALVTAVTKDDAGTQGLASFLQSGQPRVLRTFATALLDYARQALYPRCTEPAVEYYKEILALTGKLAFNPTIRYALEKGRYVHTLTAILAKATKYVMESKDPVNRHAGVILYQAFIAFVLHLGSNNRKEVMINWKSMLRGGAMDVLMPTSVSMATFMATALTGGAEHWISNETFAAKLFNLVGGLTMYPTILQEVNIYDPPPEMATRSPQISREWKSLCAEMAARRRVLKQMGHEFMICDNLQVRALPLTSCWDRFN